MKKKVLFLIESFIVGGAERALLNLVNAMDKTRFDVTVISVFKESVYEGYNTKFSDSLSPEVHYRYLIDNTRKRQYLVFNYLFNKLPKSLFHRILIGSTFDTEVAFYEGLPTFFLAESSNKKSKKIAWLHYGDGFADSKGVKRDWYKKVYSKYDCIVGVSNGVCDNFRERVCEDFNVITRYNIFDDENVRIKANELKLKSEKRGSVQFVSVGRVCEVKGYDRLLRVCLKLHNEGFDFELNIVGGGECEQLMQFVSANSMQDYIHILGHMDNPYAIIKNADWLVCSSYAEGFSTVMAESMIIGTPVISTKCCSTEELIGDDEYGLRCANSEEGLYDVLKKVLEDKSLTERYRKNAIQKGKCFSKNKLLSEIEELF